MRILLSIVLMMFTQHLWAQVDRIENQPQMSKQVSNLLLTQQLFSQSLVSAVIGDYYKKTHKNFDAKSLGDKAYLNTFLSEWSRRIESKKFRNSLEIFSDIKMQNNYLSKYYGIWNAIQGSDYKSQHFINLGEVRNQFLGYVIFSETKYPNLRERTLQIFDHINSLLLRNSGAYELAELILTPFFENEDALIRQKAVDTIGMIGSYKKSSYLPLMRDLFLPLRAGIAALPSLTSVPKVLTTAQGVGRSTLSYASNFIQNPALSWLGLGKTVSAAIHSTLPAYLFLHKVPTNPIEEPNKYFDDLEVSIAKLWQVTATVFQGILISDNTDFPASFLPSEQKIFVNDVQLAIAQSSKNFDYLKAFLQSEKHFGFDARKNNDLLAMDFMYGEVKKLQDAIRTTSAGRRLTHEDIEAIRRLVIEGPLKKYKREYPNLVGTLLGWGGNCVAQTMLLTGLLNPYRDQLPGNNQLAVVLFSDHIEPALIKENSIFFLVSGKRLRKTNGKIYSPEFLLSILLRNYKDADPVHLQADKLHLGGNLEEAGNSNIINPTNKNLIKNFGFGAKNSNGKNEGKDKRFGVLENLTIDEVGEAAAPGYTSPESATIRFSSAYDTTEDNTLSEGGSQYSSAKENSKYGGIRDQLSADEGEDGEGYDGEDEGLGGSSRFNKLKIVYNRVNSPISFDVNSSKNEITVFRRDLYVTLIRKIGTMKNPHYYNLNNELEFQLQFDIDTFLASNAYQKNVILPAKNLSNLINLSASEMEEWNLQFESFTSQINRVIRDGSLDGDASTRYLLDENPWGNSRNLINPLKSKIEKDVFSLLKSVAESPKQFASIYGKMIPRQRQALLQKFFPGYSFTWRKPTTDQFEISKNVTASRDIAFRQIKSYLQSISKDQITIPKREIPSGVLYMIDLKNWKRSNTRSDGNNPGTGSTTKKDKIENAENGPGKTVKRPLPTETEVLELSPEILIEFAIVFQGAGMQIWDSSVVNYFTTHSSWGFIDNREIGSKQIKRALTFDPPSNLKSSHFKPLLSQLGI